MSAFACWRRLDTPGHDAAHLAPAPFGWALHGAAVFMHDGAPACLRYALELNADWTTRKGEIEGFLGKRRLKASIERQRSGWHLNGMHVAGLARLVDLDLGFTPATNLPQLAGADLMIGSSIELPVAWLDVDAASLVELPQRYERRGEFTYWYEAPTVPYEALLTVSPSGFVQNYPGLWQAERS